MKRVALTLGVLLLCTRIGNAQSLGPYANCTIGLAGGGTPVAIVGGDFNDDASGDFAVADKSNNRIVVFLGDRADFAGGHCESATRQVAVALAANAAPVALAVGDFGAPGMVGGNGTLDIAVAESDGVVLLTNDGHGAFTAGNATAAGDQPGGIAVADIDGDGLLDVAVTDGFNNNVRLLFGLANNGPFDRLVTIPLGDPVIAVAVADLNLDGHLDLLVLSSNNVVSALMQSPTTPRQFPTELRLPDIAVLQSPRAFVIGDFKRDGVPDFAVVGVSSGAPAVFTGGLVAGAIGVQYVAQTVTPTSGALAAIAAADLNNNDKLDAVVAGGASVQLLAGQGNGSFDAPLVQAVGNGVSGLALPDVDGDGKPDIVSANQDTSSVTVLLSTNPPPTPTNTPGDSPTPTPTTTATPTINMDCCSVHATAGCNNAACVTCVGSKDPDGFCAEHGWDQSCVNLATGVCADQCTTCATPTPLPTTTLTATQTSAFTETFTRTPTSTRTPTVTGTLPPTLIPTRTPTPTFTITGTRPTATNTPTPTPTATGTGTGTRTFTPTFTSTPTETPAGGFGLQGSSCAVVEPTAGWVTLLPLVALLVARRRR